MCQALSPFATFYSQMRQSTKETVSVEELEYAE